VIAMTETRYRLPEHLGGRDYVGEPDSLWSDDCIRLDMDGHIALLPAALLTEVVPPLPPLPRLEPGPYLDRDGDVCQADAEGWVTFVGSKAAVSPAIAVGYGPFVPLVSAVEVLPLVDVLDSALEWVVPNEIDKDAYRALASSWRERIGATSDVDAVRPERVRCPHPGCAVTASSGLDMDAHVDQHHRHGYTQHGHHCCGMAPAGRPDGMMVARCGGPGICSACSTAAARIHAGGTA
jgi:hypothetical protein